MASKYKSTRYDPSAGLGGGGGQNPNNQLLMMMVKQKMDQDRENSKQSRIDSMMREAEGSGAVMTKRNIGGATYALPAAANFTAAAMNNRNSVDAALGLLDELDNASKSIGGGGGKYMGMFKREKADILGGSRNFMGIPIPGGKEDESIRNYESMLGGNVSMIYKILSGDVGTLNEGDVKRAKELFWQLGEGEGLKKIKVDSIRKRLLAKKAGYQGNLSGFTREGFGVPDTSSSYDAPSSPIPGSPGFQGGQGSFDPNDPDGLFA